MKEISAIVLALFFLAGCAQQSVQMPVNTTGITKTDTNKINSPKYNKEKVALTDIKKSNQSNAVLDSTGSLGSSIASSPVLQMVGNALLTGIVSGLVSKALQ